MRQFGLILGFPVRVSGCTAQLCSILRPARTTAHGIAHALAASRGWAAATCGGVWRQAAGDEGFLRGTADTVQAWVQNLRTRFAHAQESERAARLPVSVKEGTNQVSGSKAVALAVADRPP